MIKDIPKAEEFEDVAIECLVQAYNNIVQVENTSNPLIPRDEVWKYNQIVLRTSIVLIHQGLEGLMKAFICDVSPLLLIGKKRGEWKTLPNSKNESFSDLETIGGEDLIRTFYACDYDNEISKDFIKHFEEVRVKRNKIIHGLGENDITPSYVLKLVLWSFTLLLEKDSFWGSVLDKFDNHPGLKHNDSGTEIEEIFQHKRLEYLYHLLGKGELKHHFSVDITSRPYHCPECSRYISIMTDEETDKESLCKWAFLNPNTPDSTSLKCISCEVEFSIKRNNCKNENCNGNVKYYSEKGDAFNDRTIVCLSCLNNEPY